MSYITIKAPTDIKSEYQKFKKTDEYESILEETKRLRPDLKDKINFLEMTIYKWYIEEKLNLKLESPQRSLKVTPKKGITTTETVEVFKNETDWKKKYTLEEINKGTFQELGTKPIEPFKENERIDIKKFFADTPENEILYHNRLIKCTDDIC